ncbi:MAG: DnaJ domain-containing protein [bacterium]
MARVREVHQRLEGLETKTHYEVLGVAKTATSEEIRNAFRALAREFHADRFARYDLPPTDLEAVQRVFIAINRANEVLSDAAARKDYDAEQVMRARAGGVVNEAGGADLGQVFRAEKLVKEAVAIIKAGNPEAARDRFQEALKATPDDPVARAGLAYAELLIVWARGPSRRWPPRRPSS